MRRLLLGLGVVLSIAGVYMIFVPNSLFQQTQNRTGSTPPTTPSLTIQPSFETVKQLKGECLQEARDWSEQYKDKPATDDLIWNINNKYRICLAGKGLPTEDLFSYPSQGDSANTYILDSNTNVDSSYMDKLEQERNQKCLENTNTYNACMSEKNAELAEYNSCLSETSNPNHWRYGLYCSKPYKSCLKPACAY